MTLAPPTLSRREKAHRFAALAAVILTVLIGGYRLTEHVSGLLLCGVVHAMSLYHFWPTLLKTRLAAPRLFYLLVANLVVIAMLLADPAWALGLAAVFQIVSLYVSGRDHPILLVMIGYFLRHPAAFVAASFLVIISLGTVFLTFRASTTGTSLSLVDALFTAVSAVCVTGLAVVDTPVQFTRFGQGVILTLIQMGGLGIMTLSTIGARLVAGNLGLLAESAFGALLDVRGARSVYKLIKVMVISTITIELIGALLLFLRFRQDGMGWNPAMWSGLFHAVSAFCNAGFALQSDSLVPYSRDYPVLFTVMALITMGGIGFPTMVMVLDHLRTSHKTRLPVQVRVILWTSLALILLGWAGFMALEWHGALGGFDIPAKIVNGLFQSVTLRTAGFNTVSMTMLQPATIAFMILFMFIGGAPGGTAGGIKVTTLTVLLAAIPSFGHGDGAVAIGGRRISASTMYRAISVVVVSLMLVLSLHLLLLLTERQPFEAVAFEAVSAVGTVGLSLGITPQLGAGGKLLLIFGMFAGRIGPLTLTLVFATKQQKRYRLAEEPVMVG